LYTLADKVGKVVDPHWASGGIKVEASGVIFAFKPYELQNVSHKGRLSEKQREMHQAKQELSFWGVKDLVHEEARNLSTPPGVDPKATTATTTQQVKGVPESAALGAALATPPSLNPSVGRATSLASDTGLGETMTRIILEELRDQRVLLERLLTASTKNTTKAARMRNAVKSSERQQIGFNSQQIGFN
jgi:hypothetical protein